MRGPGDLKVVDVRKSFAGNEVLSGVNLMVRSGTFTTILGPSGSGKTTLLRIIAGFERPDDGVVKVGEDVLDAPDHYVAPEHRHIGYVSQNGSLFPHLTVKANVTFGLARERRRGPEVDELLDAAELGKLAKRYPHQLSGGQQQRVALARALAVEPRIVLLDEPFASLDAGARLDVRADVQAILKRVGATAILVTHDQDEALSMADDVAVIRNGVIVQSASPRDLYERPVDVGVAGFVGDANLLPGSIAGDHVTTALGTHDYESSDVVASGSVTVLIRPEQLLLNAASAEHGVDAQVLDASFHGHDTVLHVQCVSMVDTVMTVRMLGREQYVAGDKVKIAVRGAVNLWPATHD
jgi:iron(III) transport system ATP-binding protein